MSWSLLERLVGETLRRMAYQVVENGGGEVDGGIDLQATRDGTRYIVQCKQWRTYRSGLSLVRQHFGAMTAERAAGGFVVNLVRFTQEALDFALRKPIELVGGKQLSKVVVAVS
jgi:restriction system protein